MRVETVRSGGPGVWVAGLVGQRSEGFRRIRLSTEDVAELTVADSTLSFRGDGRLLRTAIRCDDPVLFLEHKHLYRQTYNKGIYPGPEYMIPFGKAALLAEGDDLTIVTYGAMVERTRKTLAKLDRAGEPVRADLIDLRSLNPVDMDSIRRSVMKTNRVLVAYEDAKSWGYGAEISARLADELFEWLDAPIRRITSTDTFIGYAPSLENASLPQVDDIAEAIVELATW